GIGFLNDTLGWYGLHGFISLTHSFARINFQSDTVIFTKFNRAAINRMHKINDSVIYAVGEGGVFAYFDSITTGLDIPENTVSLPKVSLKVMPNPVKNNLLKLEIKYPFKM